MRKDMDCGDCLERLYQYLDQELSEEDVATVRRHLADCQGCAHHFYFEERLLQKVHDAVAGDRAPERLRQSVILRFREH